MSCSRGWRGMPLSRRSPPVRDGFAPCPPLVSVARPTPYPPALACSFAPPRQYVWASLSRYCHGGGGQRTLHRRTPNTTLCVRPPGRKISSFLLAEAHSLFVLPSKMFTAESVLH